MGKTRFPLWGEVSICTTRACPAIACRSAQVRYLCDGSGGSSAAHAWSSGHVEGWALYAERLMDELGYLEKPAYGLGMLAPRPCARRGSSSTSGCTSNSPSPRATSDTTRVSGGPPSSARSSSASTLTEGTSSASSVRYLGWPGQAPSYKVGERIWLQARDDAKARQGAAFDLKAFHRAALDLGSLGLDPIRKALARL